jgi:8-amino-7-oxononanoate synthase
VRFLDHVRGALAQHAAAGLMRSPRVVSSAQGPVITVDGREAVCLCSNNYLGLAAHPALAAAAHSASAELGSGSGASRHISGSMQVHRDAEARLAAFVQQPRSLLFSTGHAANLGAVQALADQNTVVFSDALNHASLIDGCRLSRARVLVYRHRDPEHLAQLLEHERRSARAALILTESTFSMDGDTAPLRELRALADRYDAGLLVDEAHALGVLGPSGRGLCAAAGVVPDVLVGTLGKAFGSAGAFVAAAPEIIQLVENRARSYIFTTAPAPALAAAAVAAVQLVETADDRRTLLLQHASRLRTSLRTLGFHVQPGDSHIIPVILGDAAATMAVSTALLEHGVFVHGIRPPTVAPGTSRLRVTPMATHSPEHLDRALTAFRAVRSMIPA